jgi:hypothetical protein
VWALRLVWQPPPAVLAVLLISNYGQHRKDWHPVVFASVGIDVNSHEERRLELETLRLIIMEGS